MPSVNQLTIRYLKSEDARNKMTLIGAKPLTRSAFRTTLKKIIPGYDSIGCRIILQLATEQHSFRTTNLTDILFQIGYSYVAPYDLNS